MGDFLKNTSAVTLGILIALVLICCACCGITIYATSLSAAGTAATLESIDAAIEESNEPVDVSNADLNPVGTAVTVDEKTITVSDPSEVEVDGNSIFTPAEGNKYVQVKVMIENKGSDSVNSNPLNYTMVDAEGFSYTPNLFTDADQTLESVTLSSGRKTTGYIVFEVPAETVLTEAAVVYEPFLNFGDANVAWWALK